MTITIDWASWMLWGFCATLLLTTVLAGSQGVGLTRMNLPFVVGTLFTADRDRAKLYGFFAHLFIGMLFSLMYALIFEALQKSNWWMGAIFGAAHAAFLLVVFMSILPGLHPRMASEERGPESHRVLEPPGFLALNYGFQTPLMVLIAHIVFGAFFGAFYRL